MIHRLVTHAKHNVVAYIALMFSVIGGGGGYAIAATTHPQSHQHKKQPTAIVACASKHSGELFLHKKGRCAKGRHKVHWSIKGPRGKRGAAGAVGATGAAGAPAPSIFAAVDADAAAGGLTNPNTYKGLTVARAGLGLYTVTITDPTCSQSGDNVPTVTPTSRYASGSTIPPSTAVPVAYLDTNVGIGTQFTVHVGYVDGNGNFVPVDYYFDIQDTCL